MNQQTRKIFLEERRSGLGGSDVASLVAAELPKLGLKPFKTPLEIYYSKILESEEQESTIEQRRGNNAEELVCKIYSDKKNTQAETKGVFCVNKDNPFMIAHPDYFITPSLYPHSKYILECKTVHHSKAEEWKTHAPIEYLLQCVHYAIVCKVQRVDIAGMIGFEGLSGDDEFFKIYTYERDGKLEKRIIEIEEKFWENHVLKRKPPAPMTMSDTYLLQPASIKSKKITATQEIEEILKKEAELHEKSKELEKEKEILKVQAASFMDDAYRLVDSQGKSLATYGESERKTTDYKKLKELAGEEIYNQVVSISLSKRFTPTRK